MTPPPRSIRGELNDALIGGIRRRGSDAVGLVIMGMAKLAIGVVALAALLAVGAIFGYDITVLAGLATAVAGLVGWLSGGDANGAAR
jgi:hypothetical protein